MHSQRKETVARDIRQTVVRTILEERQSVDSETQQLQLEAPSLDEVMTRTLDYAAGVGDVPDSIKVRLLLINTGVSAPRRWARLALLWANNLWRFVDVRHICCCNIYCRFCCMSEVGWTAVAMRRKSESNNA